MKFVVYYCYVCLNTLHHTTRYRIDLVLKRGLFSGQKLKTIYVCEDCLQELRNDKQLRKHYKIRYRKLPPLRKRSFSFCLTL